MKKKGLKLECKVVSSLEKVFLDSKLKLEEPFPAGKIPEIDAARGETCAFQLALKCQQPIYLKFKADSKLADYTSFRQVDSVPCETPGIMLDVKDDFMLRTKPGLYPDPLRVIEKPMRLAAQLWQGVWVSVKVPEDFKPGTYKMNVTITHFQYLDNPWESPSPLEIMTTVKIRVHETVLSKQTLICTNWFYADCLAEYYHVKIWSEKFWTILENYMRDYAEHGRNMILTPLWTVPLDTKIGGERPTAQLLDISFSKGKYRFDFSKLKRWIDLAHECGIEYFEMSHFFSQWGAKATPKIMVEENGKMVRKFGWHVASFSKEYRNFLEQLMPELLKFLRKEKLQTKCYFHFSDEPGEDVFENYKKAAEPLHKVLKDEEFPVIDALSSVRYYKEGLVSRPVPWYCHLEAFEKFNIPHKWCYFAGGCANFPIRAYGAPLCRYRILGVLLYLYKMEGFLHWGHNFWFSQYSRSLLNPWFETTAGRGFSGGNSYNVYPEADYKPAASLHYESFMEAMQDHRLIEQLEKRIGFKKTCAVICKDLDYTPTMNHFPRNPGWIIEMRKRIFAELEKTSNKQTVLKGKK